MKLVKIIVERGLTLGSRDGPWHREGLQVEVELADGDDPDDVYKTISERLNRWLGIAEAIRSTQFANPQPSQRQASVASTSTTNLDAIEWRPFKSGRKGGWTYSDRPEVKGLVEKLKGSKGKTLFDGQWRYRLSGDGDSFLQRFPYEG